MNFKIVNQNNISYGHFPELTNLKILNAVSFRKGGFSKTPYDSLNLALHTEDNPLNVLKNRGIFFNLFSLNYKNMVTLKQTHSNTVVKIDTSHIGKGSQDYDNSVAEADAMVTNVPQIPLTIFTADCLPVSLVDPINKVIGLAHAGWKGTYNHITKHTINNMLDLGAIKNNIIAGLGPAIQKCCYEVSKDFSEKFDDKYIEKRNKKYYFDIIQMNEDILISSGIDRHKIIRSDFCTKSNTKLCYSYRDSKQTGRIASILMLWE